MTNPFEEGYLVNCNTPSDINEHLPVLRDYADHCYNVLELGHRNGCSASAFLASEATIVHSVDINHCRSWHRFEHLLKESKSKKEFKFWKSHSIAWTPVRKEYGLIFFDTLHTGPHLLEELIKYSPHALHWMILHDTETLGEVGEQGDTKGLRWAILEFLLKAEDGESWRVAKHLPNNNGLTVLERCRDHLTGARHG